MRIPNLDATARSSCWGPTSRSTPDRDWASISGRPRLPSGPRRRPLRRPRSSDSPAAACRSGAAQVLVTLGLSFMIADVCLMVWTGDPIRIDDAGGAPRHAVCGCRLFPTYRLAVIVIAVVVRGEPVGDARADAARRDDPRRRRRSRRWRASSASASRGLFTLVFCLGSAAGGLRGRDRRADPVGLSGASTRRCCRSPWWS